MARKTTHDLGKKSGWTRGNEPMPGRRSDNDYLAALSRGRKGAIDDPTVSEMKKNRRINARTGSINGGRGGGNLSFATGRPKDPMFYWKQNNLPYDINKPEEMKKIREYCNTPDAPVLMADGTFKPIGEIQEGESVMGWVWKAAPSGYQRKYLLPTKVLAVSRRQAPMVVEARMESGRVVRCTPDHSWANYYYSPAVGGNEYEPLVRPSKGGIGGPDRYNTMVSVTDPVEPLTERKMIEAAGYLSGMIDADGTVSGGEIRISQSMIVNGAICERIEECLNVLGLTYVISERIEGMRTWTLKGTLYNRVRLREWMPLSVKVHQAWNNCRTMRWSGGRDRVEEVVELGPGEVVSMQTETGNYTAWGFASKNCRLLYITHPIIASAIDIYSKYPLTGMELVCKDPALTDFYTTLFFDQLGYEDFLIDVGREYWTVGEAWPLGSFNETLGVWEDDELLNPDDIDVIRSPFMKEPRFEMRLPETLRDIINNRDPKWEFEALMRSYPELAKFAGYEARMPVSNVLLKQLKFKGHTFNSRGVPILMRGFRSIIQEEMLNAAQDAIADRLYTPLVLAKLGASAQDLGTNQPWVPTEEDVAEFEEALDAALAADFRVLTHHFAIEMDTVFGRENMPNMDADFERLSERQLQVFGLSKTMLSGASGGETYAADALNRDLISQLLTSYQRLVTRLYEDRARVVAEAQEHYDYEERGGKRYPIMEEVLEVDEETGEQRIVEQPKLLIPDLKIKAMNMKDEQDLRMFYEALRESGVPISQETRMVNVPINLEDEKEAVAREQVEQAVLAQEVRKDTYLALRDKGLPIPDDLRQDFEPKAVQAQPLIKAEEAPIPELGTTVPAVDNALAPPLSMDPTAPSEDTPETAAAVPPDVQQLPRNQIMQRQRPEESDEMRAGMPMAAKKIKAKVGVEKVKVAEATDDSEAVYTEKPVVEEIEVQEGRGRLLSGPRHIGARRHANVNKDTPLGETDD